MTPEQQRALAVARARRRRAEAVPASTVPGDRISGAFEDAAAQPETRLRPKGYGITDSAMMSLPFADELDAAIAAPARYLSGRASSLGEGYAQQKALSERYQKDFATQNPGQALLGTAAGIAAVGPQRLASGLLASTPVAATRMGRVGQGAATSAGLSALYGAGEGEGLQERVANAAYGGTIGAALGGGLGAIGRNAKAAATPPSALEVAKKGAYKALDDADARYSSGAFNVLVSTIDKRMAASKINPRRHVNAASWLDDLKKMRGTAEGTPTFNQLDDLRQMIREDVVNSPVKRERTLGLQMLQAIDNFTDSAMPISSKMSGSQIGPMVRKARHANLVWRKAQQIDDAIVRATRRTNKSGSGGNIDNNIRDEIFKILDNPNKRRGFTKEELATMDDIVNGNAKGQQLLRKLGKLSPNGNGLMAQLGLFGTIASTVAAGPAGLAVGGPQIAGGVSKLAADRMTTNKVASLQRLVGGGPTAPVLPIRGAMARRLLANEFGAGSR